MNDQHLTQLGPLIEASGPDRTYDFSAFTYSIQAGIESDILGSAAGTPGENDTYLNQANYVSRTPFGESLSFGYSILTDEGYIFIGSVFEQHTNGTITLSITRNEPGDVIHRYPLTYESAWTETIDFTSEFSGTQTQTTYTDDEVVDGWGTLITPAGSEPALRLRKTKTVESGNTPVTTITYLFITNSELGASITTDEQGVVFNNGAAYTVTTGGGATGVEKPDGRSFQLLAVYPNPFSEKSTFSFNLDAPGYARLQLFDLTGREVASLVDAQLPAGAYQQEFDAVNLPSGVFISRLQVSGITVARPFIIRR
jgi:hypothetical protein